MIKKKFYFFCFRCQLFERLPDRTSTSRVSGSRRIVRVYKNDVVNLATDKISSIRKTGNSNTSNDQLRRDIVDAERRFASSVIRFISFSNRMVHPRKLLDVSYLYPEMGTGAFRTRSMVLESSLRIFFSASRYNIFRTSRGDRSRDSSNVLSRVFVFFSRPIQIIVKDFSTRTTTRLCYLHTTCG